METWQWGAIGAGGGAVIIIIVVITICCCCKKKKKHQARTDVDGVENQAHNVSIGDLHLSSDPITVRSVTAASPSGATLEIVDEIGQQQQQQQHQLRQQQQQQQQQQRLQLWKQEKRRKEEEEKQQEERRKRQIQEEEKRRQEQLLQQQHQLQQIHLYQQKQQQQQQQQEGRGRRRERGRDKSKPVSRSQSGHRLGIQDDKTVDLHGNNLQQAMYIAKEHIEDMEEEYNNNNYSKKDRYIYIITGWGKHSPDNEPVIKPGVQKYLDENDYDYTWVQKGMVEIDLLSKRRSFM